MAIDYVSSGGLGKPGYGAVWRVCTKYDRGTGHFYVQASGKMDSGPAIRLESTPAKVRKKLAHV
jgi:hypothetical protein